MKFFLGWSNIASTVWNPASVNFLMSTLLMPASSSFYIGKGPPSKNKFKIFKNFKDIKLNINF